MAIQANTVDVNSTLPRSLLPPIDTRLGPVAVGEKPTSAPLPRGGDLVAQAEEVAIHETARDLGSKVEHAEAIAQKVRDFFESATIFRRLGEGRHFGFGPWAKLHG